MSSAIRLLMAAVVAALSLMGSSAGAHDLPGRTTLVHDYTCGVPHDNEPSTYIAHKRGPSATTYDHIAAVVAVDLGLYGTSACPDTLIANACNTYDALVLTTHALNVAGTSGQVQETDGEFRALTRSGVAANGGGKIPWTSWQNYPKVTRGGREYAQVGDRLYTHHAVDRLQPSGLGAPAGATGAGRSISPNFVVPAEPAPAGGHHVRRVGHAR